MNTHNGEPKQFDKEKKLNMKTLFEYAAEIGASDLLITANAAPTIRLNGELHPASDLILQPRHTKQLIWSLLNETQ